MPFNVLGGLMGVYERGHERRFAAPLTDLIMPMMSSVPPLVGSQSGSGTLAGYKAGMHDPHA